MSIIQDYQSLQSIKLNAIRQAISSACYQRSYLKTFGWFLFDLSLYLGFIWGVFASDSVWLKLGFGLLAGCVVAFMFVWAHDAAHGALFKNPRVSELFGTLFMLPSLNMYRLWSYGHNKVHHGFTSLTLLDGVWRPLTPSEYANLGAVKRFVYRLERTPYFCALHYLLHIWWPGMIRFKLDNPGGQNHHFTLNKIITLVFALTFSALAYRYAGGWLGILCAVLIPFVVFNYFIALFVFLHHTHPDIPFFDKRNEWSLSIGQLYCSTVVHCSRVSEMLIHNIMIHIPHHVDTRIPFYNLKRAYQDLRREYGSHFHEYRFSWMTVHKIFSRCQLYDYDKKIWYSIKEATHLGLLPKTAAQPG